MAEVRGNDLSPEDLRWLADIAYLKSLTGLEVTVDTVQEVDMDTRAVTLTPLDYPSEAYLS